MEANQQTLFEVVNNIVQELTEIKRITINNASNMSYNNVQEKINVDFDNDNDVPDLVGNENIVMQHVNEESESESDDEEYSYDSDLESEDENSVENENSDEVKVVSVDIDDSLDEINQQDESNGLEEQEQEENLEEVDIDTQEMDNIKVSKLEETSVLEESDNVSLSSSVSKSVYKKMNVASLKALVIEKGLSTDPGKMKKNELIELLESNA